MLYLTAGYIPLQKYLLKISLFKNLSNVSKLTHTHRITKRQKPSKVRDPEDKSKCSNVCPVRSSEEEKRGNGGAKYEEKKASGFFLFSEFTSPLKMHQISSTSEK